MKFFIFNGFWVLLFSFSLCFFYIAAISLIRSQQKPALLSLGANEKTVRLNEFNLGLVYDMEYDPYYNDECILQILNINQKLMILNWLHGDDRFLKEWMINIFYLYIKSIYYGIDSGRIHTYIIAHYTNTTSGFM